MRVCFIVILMPFMLFGAIKTPSDVYSYAITVKKKLEILREQEGVKKDFPIVQKQQNKFPRHVIQKALEVLSKINLYRVSKGYGEIYIPPYPARNITPSDVFSIVKRLDGEITPFIFDKDKLKSIKYIKFSKKTPNDVYALLWSISLAFDSLLGIHGYTPTDVYALSQKVVKTVNFLAKSQNIHKNFEKPKRVPDLRPNHALYRSYDLLQKISEAEKRLWITPSEVPQKPQRVVTPTEVYDSLQFNIAELQRIKHRLGLERYFKLEDVKSVKSPSDVVQNLEYAIDIMPTFSLSKELVQYPSNSLNKTPNDVFGVTVEILRKIEKLKNIRGITQREKIPPYIYGLKPAHAYQKAIESIEKSIKLKTEFGFYPSAVPTAPLRKITPNEVYELVLRLDGIVTLLLKSSGFKDEDEYIYKLDKRRYTQKVPSDVYNNLWKISNNFDLLLAREYTPNETYAMAARIEKKVKLILDMLNVKHKKTALVKIDETKYPSDVFALTLKVFKDIKRIQKRLNMDVSTILIPKEKNITPNTVYNSLRILNASLNQILIFLEADDSNLANTSEKFSNKTPTDVFAYLTYIQNSLNLIFKDESYE